MANLLPSIIIGMDEVVDGTLHKAPNYCKKKKAAMSHRCNQHYNELLNKKNQFQCCPFGFASYHLYNAETNTSTLYTGMLVDKISDKALYIPRIEKADKIVKLDKNTCLGLIKHDEAMLISQHEGDSHLSLLREYLHTTRSINANITNQAYTLKHHIQHRCKENGTCLKQTKSLTADSDLLRVTNRYIEFSLDGDKLLETKRIDQEVDVMKSFYKYHKALALHARKNKRSFNFHEYEGYFRFDTIKDIFDLIPHIVLQNAIKHSFAINKDNAIDIDHSFNASTETLTVEITNYGLAYSDNQLSCLTEKNKRGDHADVYAPGQGLGLYSLKNLCSILNIGLELKSEECGADNTTIDGITYPISKFKVILTFNNVKFHKKTLTMENLGIELNVD